MKHVISILALLSLTACGSGSTSVSYPPVQSPAPTVVDANQAAIDQEVAEYNSTRQAQGSELIYSGLTCRLWTVGTGTSSIASATLSTSIGSWTYLGNFNIPDESTAVGNSVFPSVLQPVIQSWYVLKCSGYVVSTSSSWHSFDVTSDDGSNLYVDGLLVNNDGNHSSQNKSAVKFLSIGIHSFEIDYMQAAGNQSLIVDMDGSPVPTNLLYH